MTVLMTALLCRVRESAHVDSQAKYEAVVKQLNGSRTAYELLHTDWLAIRTELETHRYVMSRSSAMYVLLVRSGLELSTHCHVLSSLDVMYVLVVSSRCELQIHCYVMFS